MNELVQYEEMCLVLDPNVTFEDAGKCASVLTRMHRANSWWLGDFVNITSQLFGERSSQLLPDDIPVETLRNYAWVSSRFPPSVRRLRVSWSHYQAIASLPELEDRTTALDMAEAEKLTVAQLKARIKPEANKKDKPRLTCPSCGYSWDKD